MPGEQDLGDGHLANYYSDYLTEHGLRDGTTENEYEIDDPMPFPRTRFPPSQINAMHANSDVDSSQQAQHHTLGPRHNQSAPGDHSHDGGTSSQLFQWHDWISAPASWSALTTSPSIGSLGQIEGRYVKLNTYVTYQFSLMAGSDTTFGSGAWLFSLPFAARLSTIPAISALAIGNAKGFQGGTNNYTGVIDFYDANHVIIISNLQPNPWQSSVPVAWAANNNNYFGFEITYESAN